MTILPNKLSLLNFFKISTRLWQNLSLPPLSPIRANVYIYTPSLLSLSHETRSFGWGYIALSLVLTSVAYVVSQGDFNKDFYTCKHFRPYKNIDDGQRIRLKTHQGFGFASNDKFLFGQMDMPIEVIGGYPAHAFVTYKLQSDDQQNRDEIIFEFLGNVMGQPYTLQTNVYAAGIGDREERIYLWFDPTEGFHTYSIFWNIHRIVWKVGHCNQDIPKPISYY